MPDRAWTVEHGQALPFMIAAIQAALAECDRNGDSLPELLSNALTDVALASPPGRLTEHRPDSWEATHVNALDESAMYRRVDQ